MSIKSPISQTSATQPSRTPREHASRSSGEPAAATWRKMVGGALPWVAFAALVYVPQSGASPTTPLVALLGFVSFTAGLALFADGLKRSIVAESQRPQVKKTCCNS